MGSREFKALGKSILVVVWFYAASLLVSSGVLILSKNSISFTERHSQLINIISYIIIFLGVYLTDSKRQLFTNGLKCKVNEIESEIKKIGTYIIMGLGTYLIGILITNLLIDFFPEYQEINQSFSQYEPILRFVGMVILPPLVEEYLFRHKIQETLKDGFGNVIAIVGQALLFGVLHYYMLQKIYATVIGLIFGVVKEKKGIKATVCMHMTVNFIGWMIGTLFN